MHIQSIVLHLLPTHPQSFMKTRPICTEIQAVITEHTHKQFNMNNSKLIKSEGSSSFSRYRGEIFHQVYFLSLPLTPFIFFVQFCLSYSILSLFLVGVFRRILSVSMRALSFSDLASDKSKSLASHFIFFASLFLAGLTPNAFLSRNKKEVLEYFGGIC